MDNKAFEQLLQREREVLYRFKEARSIGLAQFRSLHPDETLPKWFLECAALSCSEISPEGFPSAPSTGIFSHTVSVILYSRTKLKENEFWETINNHRVIVHLDSKSGKKSMVLTRDDQAPPTVVFKAVVHLDKKVEVLVDTDPCSLDESLYEPIAAALSTLPEWTGRCSPDVV